MFPVLVKDMDSAFALNPKPHDPQTCRVRRGGEFIVVDELRLEGGLSRLAELAERDNASNMPMRSIPLPFSIAVWRGIKTVTPSDA
ncbi:hypothetical protein Q1695_010655 [Nippostrongylus brasiliensis]|nr:hypothetical protein Q1695_010655 [Nippostrongylus brasiliensis]